LGSKSYPLFCQAGIDVDKQLKRLKATPAIQMGTCDDDFETDAQIWINQLLQHLQNPIAQAAVTTIIKRPAEGKKVFTGSLGQKVLLNDHGSNKQVYHLEFDLAEEIVYTPGNAVGIIPNNRPAEVEKILKLLKLNESQTLKLKDEPFNAKEIFRKKVSIQYLPVNTVKKYAQLVQADIPETRIDLFDLLRIYPLHKSEQLQELIDLLPGITPRLYTISSSPSTHPCQLHLTVQLHKYNVQEEGINGLGSEYITTLQKGAEVEFFLHTQKSFQLPADDKDIIMVGQGTGIAPFRSFIAERDTNGATGRNWLFFGEENRVTDFYYQSDIQKWTDIGILQKVVPAFLKKSGNPTTLPEQILKHADTIWKWLEDGCYFMVSGEKEPTGKAVEAALLKIATDMLQGDEKKATAYIKQLQKDGRFAKELY
jgi:sulfite reductase (NADPH) flavoprotein alpha-component